MSNYQVLITCIEAIAATTRENSIVTGSGGGGYVSSTRVHIDPVHFDTRIARTSEIWGRQLNGQETRFLIPGADLPIRQGHKLALLQGNGAVWAVKNFTTGDTLWMVNANTFAGSGPRPISKPWMLTTGILTAIGSIPFSKIGLETIILGTGAIFPYWLYDWITGLVIAGCIISGGLGALAYFINRRKHLLKQWTDSMASWETYLHQCAGQLTNTQFQ